MLQQISHVVLVLQELSLTPISSTVIMQYPACKPATKWTLAALSLVLVSLLLLHQLLPIGFTAKSLHIPSLKDSAEKCLTTLETPRIPNIVHFVHLVKPSPNPSFEFPFRQFTAIYSAWHYLRPDVIYIHTNVEEHLIEETVKRTTNPYTRAVSKLPGVKFSHHTAPDQTTSGVPIDKLPNQSDFVRTDILDKLGGIYLDDDSYVLRDLEPLSRIHFENIVGKQVNGQICPAVIMSTPGNKLMKAYHALQDSVFDPHFWAHHATDLLTTLAQDFQKPDHQVLILPQDTFFPFAWFPEDLKMMYQVHDDAGTPAVSIHSFLVVTVAGAVWQN